ncbi:hypothetical protein QYE76_030706 [Lolium multiflorum]|uniref:Multipolar spindle 1 n=1 Tax=Lolium multiflorum TaxID=4521 RepID=A0AAD8QTT8_LOLMU|nr:hypothetical protein QYE76_030706 [Lolium multiflorum]
MAPASRPPTATPPAASSSRIDSPSLKAALAMALMHYNRLPSRAASAAGTSTPPLIHWKRKAKERKREILRLREELKLLQDGVRGEETEPPVASCRCHFFDGCGDLQPPLPPGGGEHWVDEVLRRRFLRLARWKEKRRRLDRPLPVSSLMEFNREDEIQQLSLSTDFLVELSDSIFAKRDSMSSFATFSHQAVDFILGSVDCSDAQFSVQHLFWKLGQEEFIGQRIILLVSQKISNLSEMLLLVDPFDDSFPDMHGNMFIMIQLIEFLISDYIKNWLCCEQFDKNFFEEWVRSILKARKDLEVLENINGLYVVYIERVVGRLAREVAPAAHQGKLNLDVFSKLLC